MVDNKIEISIIGILIVIFSGLIFVSTDKSGINVKYAFINNVSTQESSSEDYLSFNIGKVNIENTGFVTKRVRLNRYFGCFLDDEHLSIRSFEVNYRGAKVEKIQEDIFNYAQKSIDISSSSNHELLMYIDSYLYGVIARDVEIGLIQKPNNMILYIFEVEKGSSQGYNDNYCTEVQKEDAIKRIEVKINE